MTITCELPGLPPLTSGTCRTYVPGWCGRGPWRLRRQGIIVWYDGADVELQKAGSLSIALRPSSPVLRPILTSATMRLDNSHHYECVRISL